MRIALQNPFYHKTVQITIESDPLPQIYIHFPRTNGAAWAGSLAALLREQGDGAVNIKQLAQELGCSTQPIYLSFSGMDELRGALTPRAVAEFERFMRGGETGGRIRLYDLRYIQFAKEEPRLFRFLFMRPNAFAEIKQALQPMIDGAIAELTEAYRIGHSEADLLHDQLWMHAHGIAAMITTNCCNWDMAKVERMLADCKKALVRACKACNVYE